MSARHELYVTTSSCRASTRYFSGKTISRSPYLLRTQSLTARKAFRQLRCRCRDICATLSTIPGPTSAYSLSSLALVSTSASVARSAVAAPGPRDMILVTVVPSDSLKSTR